MKLLHPPTLVAVLVLALVAISAYAYWTRPELLQNTTLVTLVVLAVAIAGIFWWRQENLSDSDSDSDADSACLPGAPQEAPIMSYSPEAPELQPNSSFGAFDSTCLDNPLPMKATEAEKPYQITPEDQITTEERGPHSQKPNFQVTEPVCRVNGMELRAGTYSKLVTHPGDLPQHIDKIHDTTQG